MNPTQAILLCLLAAALALMLWGRIRYDVVAFTTLVIAVLLGAVPAEQAFSGFGHPATVVIALVLVVSRGLASAGAIELLASYLLNASRGVGAHIGVMSSIAALCSGFMNNVAALALLMPVDLQAAERADRSPSLTLMPLSFATILGGMVTLIGTPPNIVVATFRDDALGAPYRMFDFAPVGAAVAVVGVAFVALVGWRLLPRERAKRNARRELRELEGYVIEVGLEPGATSIGKRLRELEEEARESGVAVLGLVRRGRRLPGRTGTQTLQAGDSILLEGGPEAVERFAGAVGLRYPVPEELGQLRREALAVMEVVVPAAARIDGRSAADLRLHRGHGVVLLGVSRQGQRFRESVRRVKLRAGDVLLLLGSEDRLPDVAGWLGCLPLAPRGLHVVQRSRALLAAGRFAIGVGLASVGLVDLPIALGGVAAAYVLLRVLPLSQIYESVEWPVIVLLGAMIPLGSALEASGGTATIAELILDLTKGLPSALVLAVLMIVTMTLSDLLDNVATTIVAAPVALDLAARLGVSADPFLMAVAVAASCAFLTPIGHKNNTIILGPGGYSFGDYWRMGLPLEILVVTVAVPMILIVWPL